jgi:hypothetical protein
VLSDAGGNTGMVAYEMTMLIKRMRKQLSATPRVSAPGPVGSSRDAT